MEETVSPITVNRSTPRVHKEPQDDSLSGACQVAEMTSDRHGFHRLRLIFDFLLPEVGTQKRIGNIGVSFFQIGLPGLL